ncbi:hypothetical protein pb186bvf_006372 [Paramecium bursaria]
MEQKLIIFIYLNFFLLLDILGLLQIPIESNQSVYAIVKNDLTHYMVKINKIRNIYYFIQQFLIYSIKISYDQDSEQNTNDWEDFLNKNTKLRQIIFKIDNYQKFIYEKNVMNLVDQILYNDKDNQEIQQFLIDHNQNQFRLLDDFSQQENKKLDNHLPSKDQRKKFFDCFKNQHKELQCQAGEKICLNLNCTIDRVMCQTCQTNHKKCNKFIQIDQIIDSIQAADKKFMVQNTEIHLLISPKLPCSLKTQILKVFFGIQKNPNIQIFPKSQQQEFLKELAVLNHQIDLLDQHLQQPLRQIEQKFNQYVEDQSFQDNSTDTDQQQGQCAHQNKNTIFICFQCNIDPIFCDQCYFLHQNHKSQTKKLYDEIVLLCNNNEQRLNKLIQTCRFLQVLKQERKNDNQSLAEVRAIKNKAKQMINSTDLMEVDFQLVLDFFRDQNILKTINETLQEKEKIIVQKQSEITELKQKYDETLKLREENEVLGNKCNIAQNKCKDLLEKYQMFEKQINELTQENKQLKKNEKQQSQEDFQLLQQKLQEQTSVNTESQYQIQLLKNENESSKQKIQQQQQKNQQDQQKNSEEIKQLKQWGDKLNIQLEQLKQNNNKLSQKQTQVIDQEQDRKIKQLEDELMKYKSNHKNLQVIDQPFYKQMKCRCGRAHVTNICYQNLSENVLLCDQCTLNIRQQCIFVFNFQEQQEQVKISHQSHQYDKIVQIQKEFQMKNQQIYDPYQYLNSSQFDQDQLLKAIQFAFAKDLLNYINIELQNKTGKLKDNLHNLMCQFINFQGTLFEFSNQCANQIQNVMKCIPSNFINQQETELNKQCDKLEQSQLQLQFLERILQQYLIRENIEDNLELDQLQIQLIPQQREIKNILETAFHEQQTKELIQFEKYVVGLSDKKTIFIFKEKKVNYKINLQENHPIRLDIKIDNKFTFYGLIIGNLVDSFNPDITMHIYCQKQKQKYQQIYFEKLRCIFIKLLINKPQIFEQNDQIAIYLNLHMSQQCGFQLYKTSSLQNDCFTVKNEPQFFIDSFVKTISQKQDEGLIASLIAEN